MQIFRKICKVIGLIVLVIVVIVVAVIGYLTVVEFRPADVEDLEISGTASKTISEGDSLRIMTWNVGYGALGDNADFFMDGGSSVVTASKERVQENMNAIVSQVQEQNPDVAFFQEVDLDSSRSYHVDESELLRSVGGYTDSFATNFKVAFVPYPIPPIGKVDGGILTMSKYETVSAQRVSLPVPFKWPVRIGNLKRCLDVTTIPLECSEHNLVAVNLHLEAYDDGEGKKAQTEQLGSILFEAAERGDYVIASGDFNQVFSNVDASAYPTLEGMWHPGVVDVTEFGDAFQFVMDSATPTCRSLDRALDTAESTDPADFQYYMIDGFIVSSNLQIDKLKTIDLGFKNSDHNPVVMDVTLK